MPKINFQGKEVDATEIEFQTRKEDWNEYQLMDGSYVKIKLVVGGVFRIPDKYDVEGNPVYVVRSQNVIMIASPDNLKKKQ